MTYPILNGKVVAVNVLAIFVLASIWLYTFLSHTHAKEFKLILTLKGKTSTFTLILFQNACGEKAYIASQGILSFKKNDKDFIIFVV